ncbi:unnamed protein product [Spodoptera littoralis]|uniref:PiggyBac transposable element-derived protein domain-containing protein n=1 Tax=Spodoptera littoralis TaxID=7109 RepID=A0A9P0N815_SPOLI|nr:unnamed protein product [Spodoptera littoralis]CAH1643161.1 unnamed protein product [Spodoptera littoralis]
MDESMIQFKGISWLKQNMLLKPIKRGYKVWTIADSETSYVFEFQIYTGKRDDQSTEFGVGANVVKCLTPRPQPSAARIAARNAARQAVSGKNKW